VPCSLDFSQQDYWLQCVGAGAGRDAQRGCALNRCQRAQPPARDIRRPERFQPG
jgi:hypothetical protein